MEELKLHYRCRCRLNFRKMRIATIAVRMVPLKLWGGGGVIVDRTTQVQEVWSVLAMCCQDNLSRPNPQACQFLWVRKKSPYHRGQNHYSKTSLQKQFLEATHFVILTTTFCIELEKIAKIFPPPQKKNNRFRELLCNNFGQDGTIGDKKMTDLTSIPDKFL